MTSREVRAAGTTPVILSRRSAAKDLQMRCRWLVLRILRSFAVYAAQDDGREAHSFAATFAHASFSVTVRLNTTFSEEVSGSTLK